MSKVANKATINLCTTPKPKGRLKQLASTCAGTTSLRCMSYYSRQRIKRDNRVVRILMFMVKGNGGTIGYPGVFYNCHIQRMLQYYVNYTERHGLRLPTATNRRISASIISNMNQTAKTARHKLHGWATMRNRKKTVRRKLFRFGSSFGEWWANIAVRTFSMCDSSTAERNN